jgi:hypothetical protein
MQGVRENQMRPLTDGKNEIYKLIKRPSMGKLDGSSKINFSNSATLPHRPLTERPEKVGISTFSNKKHGKLPPVRMSPSNASLNEKEPTSATGLPNTNQQTPQAKQSHLRKSILAAKQKEEQMEKDKVNVVKKEEIKFEITKKEDSLKDDLKKENIEEPSFFKENSEEKKVNKEHDNKENGFKNFRFQRPRAVSTNKKENFIGEIKGNLIKWKQGDFVGSGNFGQVHRAMELESGKIIAIKKIPFTNRATKESLSDLEKELTLLQKLKHKNIVEYIGHEQIENDLYIYLEYVSGGNIRWILTKYGALPEQTIKVYAKQILTGLEFLHSQRVIHKDIKGSNILVDAEGTVKLADFGCAGELEKTLSEIENIISETLKGSVPWMAPEVVQESGYRRRSDIWSFGCTILEMATGKLPWSEKNIDNQVTLLMKIATGNEIPLIPDTISKDLDSFIRCCLQRDANARPHAKDLLKHPFLQSLNVDNGKIAFDKP